MDTLFENSEKKKTTYERNKKQIEKIKKELSEEKDVIWKICSLNRFIASVLDTGSSSFESNLEEKISLFDFYSRSFLENWGRKPFELEAIETLRETNKKLKKDKRNETMSEMISIIADILEENRRYRNMILNFYDIITEEINHNFEVCNDSLKWILDKFED